MNRIVQAMGWVCFFYVGQMAGVFGATVLPSDLVGKCRVVSAVVWMDDYESGSMTLADEGGRRLLFNYGGVEGEIIEYGDRKKGGMVQSVAGGKQEQVLLKILHEVMVDQFTPVPVYAAGDGSDSAFWRYRALGHFMRVLDYRCRHKSGKIPWDVVEKGWSWGGNW